MGKIYSASAARIGWHPAFVQALQLELEPYLDKLQFRIEHQLTSEPLRVDLVVVRKKRGLFIDKNIASGFRAHNLIEYKSPEDYLSTADFHRVCAYANLYLSQTGIPETELCISFVGSRHPHKLFAYLKKVRGNTVEEKSAGIYIVKGEAAGIQIIDTRRLPEGENLWLKGLKQDMETERARSILEEGRKRIKSRQMGAYLYAIFRANPQTFLEVSKMRNNTLTFDDVLVQLGLTAKWKEEGEKTGVIKARVEVAQTMAARGYSPKEVVQTTGLDMRTVRSLYHGRRN
jgi:hypothetical protein